MNKQLLSLLSLLLAMVSSAQKNNFGIINYTIPAGYQLVKNDNVLTYFSEDKSTGAYCNIFIYKMIPGQGGVQPDFDFAWSNQVQKPFKVTGTASMQPVANLKGWQFLLGTAKYADNGVATLAMLVTFSGESNMQSICILANSDKYKADIESFIASVDVAREINTSGNTPTGTDGSTQINTGNTKTEKTPAINTKGPSFYVWMRATISMPNVNDPTGVVKTKFKWIIICSNGDYIGYMPSQGMWGTTKANSNETHSWGYIKDTGKEIQLLNDYYKTVEKVGKVSSDVMSANTSMKSMWYYKCKTVDGLKLEGEWSTGGARGGPYWYKNPNFEEGMIVFHKDGSFENKGGLYISKEENGHLTYRDQGNGTYTIKDFTLLLTYSDGAVFKTSITGYLSKSAEQENSMIFISQHPYFKNLNKK